MSPPGTISGSPDPDDRLHAESVGRVPRPIAAVHPADIPPPPGLCEEALFRGLIQRRLLEGWGPVAAIVVTGFEFTFLHPPFVRALMLLPGCLWLGYVAWRCGSILPRRRSSAGCRSPSPWGARRSRRGSSSSSIAGRG